MKFNYLLVFFICISSPLFGYWADPKFPDKLIQRYPAYKQRIEQLNKEIVAAWNRLEKNTKDKEALSVLERKSKELADLVCEAARKEIKNQITEQSEFVIL